MCSCCSTTYSAVNALAGHFNSFGLTAPVPKKRLERIQKVRWMPTPNSASLLKKLNLCTACNQLQALWSRMSTGADAPSAIRVHDS